MFNGSSMELERTKTNFCKNSKQKFQLYISERYCKIQVIETIKEKVIKEMNNFEENHKKRRSNEKIIKHLKNQQEDTAIGQKVYTDTRDTTAIKVLK